MGSAPCPQMMYVSELQSKTSAILKLLHEELVIVGLMSGCVCRRPRRSHAYTRVKLFKGTTSSVTSI